MRVVIGILLVVLFVVVNFIFDVRTNQDADLSFWSRVSTFLLIICIVLIMIRRFNIKKEFKTFFKFKRGSSEFERSVKIIFGGTILSIITSVFVIAPVISLTLIQLNASEFHKCHPAKTKVINSHCAKKSKNHCRVDIVYDGKPITVKINADSHDLIESSSQLPNLYRGRLGFYFIKK